MGNIKGLGRGLDSLLPGAEKDLEEKDGFFICPVNSIQPNPYQPRKEFASTGLDELADSIRAKGIIQPLLVYKSDSGKKGFYLIAGERRLRAAKIAGLKKVPVIIKDVSSTDDLLELALIENIQRQDLNPIEEAEAYSKLVNDFNLTQNEIAKRVGKRRTTITNMLRLLKLPDFVKNDIQEGTLSMGHARCLLSVINDAKLLNKIRAQILSKRLSVRQTEDIVKSHKNNGTRQKSRLKKLTGTIAQPYSRALTNALNAYLGTKAKILQRGSQGKIEVEYSSPEDLERILKLIIKE